MTKTMTKEDVVAWLQENPNEAAGIFASFQMGSAIGHMFFLGMSEEQIRDGIESAIAVRTHGYAGVTGKSPLELIPDVKKDKR